jgi:hypothetical protein
MQGYSFVSCNTAKMVLGEMACGQNESCTSGVEGSAVGEMVLQ